jgi:hypothetical protein
MALYRWLYISIGGYVLSSGDVSAGHTGGGQCITVVNLEICAILGLTPFYLAKGENQGLTPFALILFS